MDDLVESMQMKNKLTNLRLKMTISEIANAMRKILLGLLNENTPLSDFYIQSSVAFILEYISTETDALNTDAYLVNTAASIFNQMTISENRNIN